MHTLDRSIPSQLALVAAGKTVKLMLQLCGRESKNEISNRLRLAINDSLGFWGTGISLLRIVNDQDIIRASYFMLRLISRNNI